MSNTTYLVTGGNRGIGFGLVTALLQRPNTTVVCTEVSTPSWIHWHVSKIATVRDPSRASPLEGLSTGEGSKLIIVRVDSADADTATAAVEELQSKHKVTSLDVVIANAAIGEHYKTAAETDLKEAERHYLINFIGPLALFKATLPLLEKSAAPKFVGVSSAAGSIGYQENLKDMKTAAYGSSKAAFNFLLQRIHLEHPNITTFPISPG